MQDAYQKLELKEKEALLPEVNLHLSGSEFDPEQTTIMSVNLDFYPGHKLLDLADYSVSPEKRRYVVYKDSDNIVPMNWTNEPIYRLNEIVPVQLNEDTIADYVRFFFMYVRGKKGKFQIVENIDDIPWHDDPPPNARKSLSEMVKPVSFEGKNEDGDFELIVRIVFKNALFKSKVIVSPDGFVSLSDEELLIDDMPVSDDVFGQ